ncbi:ketosynthase chain-length factor [Kineosporia rhizophila]|uniref:beta-ketoacyl synthase N-terminal-like domain-containing protein n=1 Tax=Kineosporia rhizophila TaxID=84633 RepID=UPI001E37DBEC|nr:ketosynthase chain-length factor [Kineosporia rhizophila]
MSAAPLAGPVQAGIKRGTGLGTAAVTGIDIVSPLGLSREEHWQAVLDGVSGLAPTARFDSARLENPVSGEAGDLPLDRLPPRLLPATDRMTQMSLLAAEGAIADSGLEAAGLDRDGVGVVTAASAGGYAFGQKELQNLWAQGPEYVSTHQSYAWFYAVNTGQISIRHKFKGHSGVLVADDAGGLDALAASARRLQRGNHTVLTGAVDSTMCPWGRVAHVSTGLTSPVADPQLAYLPFDRRARGWVQAEGGAHLVLTSTPAPGAYGRLLGHGATIDGPGEDSTVGLVRAVRTALQQAGLQPRDVDAVFADAAGARRRDLSEANALTQVFGAHSVPVTAPKAATGRMGSGTAPLDVAMALLSIRDQVLPPTINVEPDPALGIDLCRAARRTAVRNVLVLARGIGGFNSALIVGA